MPERIFLERLLLSASRGDLPTIVRAVQARLADASGPGSLVAAPKLGVLG